MSRHSLLLISLGLTTVAITGLSHLASAQPVSPPPVILPSPSYPFYSSPVPSPISSPTNPTSSSTPALSTTLANTISTFSNTAQKTTDFLKNLTTNTPLLSVSTTTATTLIAATSIAIAIANTSAAASTSSSLFSLINLIFPFLALRSRTEPWGRVTEEITNQPIKSAIVTILDKAKRPRATVKTRDDGTFGIILPPGQYHILVNKPNYIVPATPKHVSLFPGERIYTHGYLDTKDEKVLQNIVIPLRYRDNSRKKSFRLFQRNLKIRWRIFQARWASPFLVFGATLNTINMIIKPSVWLVALSVIYVFLLLAELAFARTIKKAIGRVYDIMSKNPIPLALVRLIDPKEKHIVATEVTSPRGQFLLRPNPGSYRLQVAHSNYQPYTNEKFSVGQRLLKSSDLTISLDPKPSSTTGFAPSSKPAAPPPRSPKPSAPHPPSIPPASPK